MSASGNELAKLRIDKSRKKARRGQGGNVLALVILLALAGGGYALYAKQFAPIPVHLGKITRQSGGAAAKGATVITASGYVVPRHKVEVSPKIIGHVKELLVKRGDRVNEGDVLLRLEDDEYQARLKAAEANVATLQARLEELRAGARPQEKAAATATVTSAEATLRSAQQDFDRMNALAAQGAVSRQELDRSRASLDVARARADQERKQADLVHIGPRREVVEAAEAMLHQAEADLNLARTSLEYTVIRAPISGTILEKIAEKGELVTNTNFGGTRGAKNAIVTMADLSDLQVEVDVNENDLPKVQLGQPCEIRLDSRPDYGYQGAVDEISPQADRQKGTVQAKVRILNPDDAVKTELNARVTFLAPKQDVAPADADKTRLWIPKESVVQGPHGPTVYLVSDGVVVARAVKLGGDGENGVEVTDGLAGTEQLIMEPLDKLKDGARVAVGK
jgi:HlyD family secretion protein